MSKELYTPKQALNNIRDNYFNGIRTPNYGLEHKWFNIVETELNESESWKRDYFELKKALEIIKELILEDLAFNDKEQQIEYSFGCSTLCVKIRDKEQYNLLKEVLL